MNSPCIYISGGRTVKTIWVHPLDYADVRRFGEDLFDECPFGLDRFWLWGVEIRMSERCPPGLAYVRFE